MSDTSDQSDDQTPAELAAALSASLDEAVPPDLRQRLEPELSFATERAWSAAQGRAAQ